MRERRSARINRLRPRHEGLHRLFQTGRFGTCGVVFVAFGNGYLRVRLLGCA